MNTMHGAFFFACSNMSRTRAAPTPTNISTKSEPEIEKNGTFGLAGDGFREQRLAGTRGADHQHAARNAAAELLELGRVAQEFDQLGDFLLASSQPATSANVTVLFASSSIRALLLPNENAPPRPPPCIWRMKKIHTPISSSIGNQEMKTLRQERLLFFRLAVDLDPVFQEVADHPDVAGAVGREFLLVARHPGDLAALDRRRLDLAALGRVHEFGIGNSIPARLAGVELLDHDQHHHEDHEPRCRRS